MATGRRAPPRRKARAGAAPAARTLAARLAALEARVARLELGRAPTPGDGRASRVVREPGVKRCPGCGLPLRRRAGRCAACGRPLDRP
jgi:hypothetical protein